MSLQPCASRGRVTEMVTTSSTVEGMALETARVEAEVAIPSSPGHHQSAVLAVAHRGTTEAMAEVVPAVAHGEAAAEGTEAEAVVLHQGMLQLHHHAAARPTVAAVRRDRTSRALVDETALVIVIETETEIETAMRATTSRNGRATAQVQAQGHTAPAGEVEVEAATAAATAAATEIVREKEEEEAEVEKEVEAKVVEVMVLEEVTEVEEATVGNRRFQLCWAWASMESWKRP